jgi:hypothetical protein
MATPGKNSPRSVKSSGLTDSSPGGFVSSPSMRAKISLHGQAMGGSRSSPLSVSRMRIDALRKDEGRTRSPLVHAASENESTGRSADNHE